MARSHTCYIEDEKGRPVAEAWCRAFNVSDPANPTLVETQYSAASGATTFTALPDNAPVDILAIWGKQTKYFRNVLSSDGDNIDTAVDNQHVQNTDDYAAGVLVVTGYPGAPVEGEMVVL